MSVLSFAVAAIVAVLFIPLIMRDRVARFWGLGALLSLIPIAAVGPENRLLGFVGLGSMALLAQLTQVVFARSSDASVPRVWKGFAWAATLILLVIHLIAAPLLGIARIAYQASVSSRMTRAMASVPSDQRIESQDLVLINPPDHIYLVTAIWAVKRLENLPMPRHMRALSSGGRLEVTRVGPRSLRVLFPVDSFRRHSVVICAVKVIAFQPASGSRCRVCRLWSSRWTPTAIPSRCCTSSRYRSKILRCAG